VSTHGVMKPVRTVLSLLRQNAPAFSSRTDSRTAQGWNSPPPGPESWPRPRVAASI